MPSRTDNIQQVVYSKLCVNCLVWRSSPLGSGAAWDDSVIDSRTAIYDATMMAGVKLVVLQSLLDAYDYSMQFPGRSLAVCQYVVGHSLNTYTLDVPYVPGGVMLNASSSRRKANHSIVNLTTGPPTSSQPLDVQPRPFRILPA